MFQNSLPANKILSITEKRIKIIIISNYSCIFFHIILFLLIYVFYK